MGHIVIHQRRRRQHQRAMKCLDTQVIECGTSLSHVMSWYVYVCAHDYVEWENRAPICRGGGSQSDHRKKDGYFVALCETGKSRPIVSKE